MTTDTEVMKALQALREEVAQLTRDIAEVQQLAFAILQKFDE